jgi:hypothetical protein
MMDEMTTETLARDTELIEKTRIAFRTLGEAVLLITQAFNELKAAVPPDLDLTALDDEADNED